MNQTTDRPGYTPGQYGKKRMTASEWSDINIRKWTDRQRSEQARKASAVNHPAICFSRKIGAGALEIADILAERIGFRVVDREILEHMASDADLAEKTVALFDERYPGRMAEFMSFLTKEKSFVQGDYARQLARSVMALSELESTVFVGRGVHLILPRDRVLAVRIICSQEFRVERLERELGIGWKDAESMLKKIDKEQSGFFKSVYGKSEASPYEFDLVINRDHIPSVGALADLVAMAFERKFKTR